MRKVVLKVNLPIDRKRRVLAGAAVRLPDADAEHLIARGAAVDYDEHLAAAAALSAERTTDEQRAAFEEAHGARRKAAEARIKTAKRAKAEKDAVRAAAQKVAAERRARREAARIAAHKEDGEPR